MKGQPLDPSDLANLRRWSLENLWTFCRWVLNFPDLTANLHKDVTHFLQQPDRRKLINLPRGHLKTTLCTIGYPLWRIVQNPNIRILLVCNTQPHASKWLLEIETHFMANTLLRALFPEVIPRDFSKVRWNQLEMEVRRTHHFPEATVSVMGAGGSSTSPHYDLIIEDDLIDENDIASPENVRKKIEWHKRADSLFVDPSKGEEIVVGNCWGFNDLVSYILEVEKSFCVYKRAALEPMPGFADDEWLPGLGPIWPERFSKQVLQGIAEKQGPSLFGALYMNAPQHEDPRILPPEGWRTYTTLPRGVPLRTFTAIDPAVSEKGRSKTALVTVGIDPDYTLYALDARADYWGVDEWIDHLFEVQQRWHSTVGLESVLFSRLFSYPIREAMRRHGVRFPLVLLPVSREQTKEVRIAAILQEVLVHGALWFRASMTELRKEYDEFPRGATKDLLDALAHAVSMARVPHRAAPLAQPNTRFCYAEKEDGSLDLTQHTKGVRLDAILDEFRAKGLTPERRDFQA